MEGIQSATLSVACIQQPHGVVTVGLCLHTPENKQLEVGVFDECSEKFPFLESTLLSLSPERLVISASSSALVEAAAAAASSATEVVRASLALEFAVEADLTRLAKNPHEAISVFSSLPARAPAAAFSALLTVTGLLNDRSVYGNLSFGSLALNYLRMDKASLNALNVFPAEKCDDRKNTNIFGFLNKCRSPLGQRRLRLWLRQPLVDRKFISQRHDAVAFLLTRDAFRQKLQAAISLVPDFARYLAAMSRAEKSGNFGNFGLEEMHKLFEAVVAFGNFCGASEVKQDLENFAPAHFRSQLERLSGLLDSFGGFLALFEQSVDLEGVKKGRYVIARSFDGKLSEIADERDRIDAEMDKYRGRVAKKTGIENVKISDAQTPFNFALRVPKKAQSDAQKFPGVKQVQVNKAEYLFTTDEFQSMADELVAVDDRFARASEKVLAKVLQVAATYAPAISDLADIVADLDVLAALALVAGMHRLTRAEISDHALGISLKRARHVLVESRLMETSGSAAYVPNDLEISPEQSLVVVTGPNMAGKSTFLRSSGLCVLLNQIGSFVPCEAGSRLPVLTAIFSRVGASDEQLRGVSTFMQEMIETSVILKMADERSLVLVDELGRGTNTLEGLGIAWAVAEELQKRRVPCLFATHFVELADIPRAVNLHAGAVFPGENSHHPDSNAGEIIFTYHIKPGVAQHSYGTHVAKLAGYPEAVVSDANSRLSSLSRASLCCVRYTYRSEQAKNDESDSIYRKQILARPGGVHRSIQRMPEISKVSSDMDDPSEMRNDALAQGAQAVSKFATEKEAAAAIKAFFDAKYAPNWHCVVGKNFAAHMSYENKTYIFFYVGQVGVLLYKMT